MDERTARKIRGTQARRSLWHRIGFPLASYGFAHAVIDASCAAILFGLLHAQAVSAELFAIFIVLYNVLAFGLQPFLGHWVDESRMPRHAAIGGCVLVGIALFASGISPLVAVIFAGVGNAFFHVAGGVISLHLTPGRATAPGVFVAPGAVGLLIGTLMGTAGFSFMLPMLALLALSCGLILSTEDPSWPATSQGSRVRYFEISLLLLLLAVVFRSLIGSVIVLPWKNDILLLVILTIAVFLGKALGGIFGDKFGWSRTAVFALLISAPLLALGAAVPVLSIAGMFLFNMAMPITLVAIVRLLPGRPGFAFGLTCLGLLIGAAISFSEYKLALGATWFVFGGVIFAAIAIFSGLLLLRRASAADDAVLR